MPELPEVETVVRTLEYQIQNAKIKDVTVYYPKIIDNVGVEDFRSQLMNQRFVSFSRRGKFLLFILDDYVLITHLRM